MRRAFSAALLAALALIAAASLAPAEQSPRADTTERLLSEVHQLRVAIERQSAVGARVQLMTGRLAIQDDRVYKLSEQLDAARRELSGLDRQLKDTAMREQQMEEFTELASDMRQQREYELARKAMKFELAAITAQQETLRLREQELANALAVEQAKLDDITRRLDDLERLLADREPR